MNFSSRLTRLLIVGLLLSTSAESKDQQPLRIALRAPDASVWSIAVKKLAEDVQAKTQSKVQLRFLTAGVTGTDDDALENVYRSKLAGALITGPTLSKIKNDFRVVERPFENQSSKDLGWSAWNQNLATLEKHIEAQNMKLVSTFRVGKIYCAFKAAPKSLKNEIFWAWRGDKEFQDGLTKKGLKFVESTPDQVDKLAEEGKITAACAPLESLTAMKWQNKFPHLLKSPVSVAVGAFLFSKKHWEEIPKLDRTTILELSRKSLATAEAAQEKLDAKVLEDSKKAGFTLVEVR